MQKEKTKNVFENFTNLYELSKTLRFELKPVGNTQKMLEENEVFKKDKIVDENYRKIKYYFDILHREFTKESLEDVVLDYQEYYAEFKNDQKSKKLPKIEENLRKNLVKFFDKKANDWKEILAKQSIKLKQNGFEILFEKDNLEILKFVFQKKDGKIHFVDILTGELKQIDDANAPDIETKTIFGEKENLFESFEGFQGYLMNFHQSRKNFYSEKDQTTAISNRAINESLRRFCDNLKQLEEKKEDYALLELSEKENKILNLEFYNKCLIQDGIDEYNYAIGAINAKINLYNQKNKDKKLRQFKSLYKQILSPREQRIDTEIEKDEEVFVKMREFIALNEKKIAMAKKLFIDFAEHQEKYAIDEIYIKGVALNTISSRWFSSWAAIGEKIMTGKGDNKKFPDFIPLGEIKKQFDVKNTEVKAEDLFRSEYKEIYEKSSSHYETFLLIWKKEFEESFAEYKKYLKELQEAIEKEKIFGKESREKQVEKIKNYVDSALGIFQMMKYFALEKGKKKVEDNPQDQNFYNVFNDYYYGEDDYNLRFIQIYSGFRNFLTKKQFKTDKIQLNFESSSLLKGYDKDLESQRKVIILRENNNYYLAILENNNNHIFEDENKIIPQNNEATVEKMYFKQQTNVFRQLPRFGFPYKKDKTKGLFKNGFRNFDENKFIERQSKYGLTDELLFIKDEFDIFQDSKEKGDVFDCNKLNKLITYYKKIIEVDYKNIFDVEKILKTDYKELNNLYQDFESSAYELKFKNISKNYVDDLVENKKLYLFKIYNKDFSEYKTGKDNLHTIYFKALFGIDTVNDKKLIQLGANAKIFFRPKSIKKEIDNDRKVKREIIKNKRYTEDKYSFHCPIILNSGKEKNPNVAFKIINDKVLKIISETNKIRLIGIDRGEKHLLYLSVIDLEGNIHQLKSLNAIIAPNNNLDPA